MFVIAREVRLPDYGSLHAGVRCMIEMATGLFVLFVFAKIDHFESTSLYIISISLLIVYQVIKNGPRMMELWMEMGRERRRLRAAEQKKRIIVRPEFYEENSSR